MRNYTSKTVYLGIDVHKKTYAVTAICEGLIVKRDTLTAVPEILIAYCKKYFVGAEIKSAYEAGFCGFHLHRRLEAEGIKNMVIDAAGIEVAVGDRVKTDKRDSLKLATHLANGRLKSIHIPSREREDYRTVTRLRETMVKERSRVACQLKSLLFQHGLIGSDDKRKVSEKWVKALEGLLLPQGLKYAVGHFISMWRYLDAKVKEIDKEMEVQAQNDGSIEVVYRSGPCIGPTSARILANELGDMSQFDNERQLFSYVGLTPTEHSSGEHIRQGHITRQGKPILRKILVQIAWKAIRFDVTLKETFERIKAKVGAKRAIIGIARRLAGRLRACFRNKKTYSVEEIRQEQDRKTRNTCKPQELSMAC